MEKRNVFNKLKNSLRFKIVVFFSLIFILTSAGITWINYTNSKSEILKSLNRSASQTVTINAQQLSTWVQTRLAEVGIVANTDLVKSMDYGNLCPIWEGKQKGLKRIIAP